MKKRFEHLVSRIRYKNWRFEIGKKGSVCFLQIRMLECCHVTGELGWQAGRKWMLSEHMTDSEVVQTALLAVLTAEEHEAREQFHFEGKAVFGPHHDVRALATVEERDVRTPLKQGG